ncbi:unnamed protein product [Cylicocyclus nassatus]|nr:unnamed protein product [Cylicocyclus nassatus]
MAFGWYHTRRRWRFYCSVLLILSVVVFFSLTIFIQHDMKDFENLGNFDSLQDIQEFINMVNSTYNAVRIQ